MKTAFNENFNKPNRLFERFLFYYSNSNKFPKQFSIKRRPQIFWELKDCCEHIEAHYNLLYYDSVSINTINAFESKFPESYFALPILTSKALNTQITGYPYCVAISRSLLLKVFSELFFVMETSAVNVFLLILPSME